MKIGAWEVIEYDGCPVGEVWLVRVDSLAFKRGNDGGLTKSLTLTVQAKVVGLAEVRELPASTKKGKKQ